jgi:hypothetical protein
MMPLFMRSAILILVLIAGLQCELLQGNKMFNRLDADRTGITFKNELHYSDSLSVLDFEYMFNGAGVAPLDVNKDGLMDVFFTGNRVSARLYLNKGGNSYLSQSARRLWISPAIKAVVIYNTGGNKRALNFE